MLTRSRRVVLSTLCIFALTGFGFCHANEDFFRGKRMTYIVGTKPGGGYDTFARLIAKHLVKHLPVESVTVKNVPGAGHLIGARHTFTAKPDGLTIGTFNTGLIYTQMLGLEEIGIDLRQFNWIGKADSEPRVFVVGASSGIQKISQLKQRNKEFPVASSGRTSASNIEMAMVQQALGLSIKPVHGYSGGDGELAIMRGDVVGTIASYSAFRNFLDQNHGRLILQMGGPADEFPGVPTLASLVTDDTGRRFARLIDDMSELSRLTAAPPGLPAARLATLRKAYMATLTDPDLLREAAVLKLTVAPLAGDQVARKVAAALDDSDVLRGLLPRLR
jgi:tripartite-type tricarboxylate transporter receptor subunit TctC